MQVTIKLVGVLADRLPAGHPLPHPNGTNTLDLDAGADVANLLGHIGLSAESEYFAMINGDHVPTDKLAGTALNEGDELVLVPPMKGG